MSFSCGSLRSVCKYLGILIPPSLTGGPHQEARAEKGYKAVGKLNAIWANHKGIGLGEEIQLWMTYGWSTLGFGCELWPWGDCLWAEKVESVMLRTLLGVSSKASYPAMCWLTGLLPVQERIWLKAIDFLLRSGYTEGTLEAQALSAQYQMWDQFTQGGMIDPAPQIQGVFWVHGLLKMLGRISWGTEHQRQRLVQLRGADLKAACLSVRSKIKATMEQRLRQRLAGGKFDFLMTQLPDFSRRAWLDWTARWARKHPRRFLLSQHRLVVETGRWRRQPRDRRICTLCQEDGSPQVGDEQHYLHHCPCTAPEWTKFRQWVQQHFHQDIGAGMGFLGKAPYQRVDNLFGTHQWRHLGEQLARTLHRILEIAEKVNVGYNAAGPS